MSPADRAELHTLAAGHSRVVVRDYEPDLRSYMAAADVVVAMGGYNTTAEILALQSRAIVVPRTWRSGEHMIRAQASMDEEQLVRAQALEKLGLLELLHPDLLSPERLADRIAATLARPRTEPKVSVNLRGVDHVAEHILSMASGEGGITDVAP